MIYGCGGHGAVIEDTVLQLYSEADIQFFDNSLRLYDKSYHSNWPIIIAIGDNIIRKKISNEVEHKFLTLVHPTAYVAPSVKIGEGTVVLANAVIQANAIVGRHCIINSNVTIDHDAVVGDFVSIYPGSYVASFATVLELKTLEAFTFLKRGTIY